MLLQLLSVFVVTKSLFWPYLEQILQQILSLLRQRLRNRHRLCQNLLQNLGLVLWIKWRFSRQHVIQQRSLHKKINYKAEPVSTLVVPFSCQYLWCDILRSATYAIGELLISKQNFRQAEISKFYVPLSIKQNIFGLQISVYNASFV